MKKFSLFLVVLLIFGLTACGAKTTNESSKPVVYASFYPIYDLTAKIAGDKAEVKTIIPQNVGPHGWEPTTKDIAEISKSNLVLYLGMGLDSWISKIKDSGTNAAFFEVSNGVEPIKSGNVVNPHIWLSPKSAQIIAKNIKDALQKTDAKNKDYYEKNYEALNGKLAELDKEYKNELSNTKQKTFIVFHSAFDYIARDYGLNEISLVGMSDEAEPSPARMSEVVNLIKKENIKYIFREEPGPTKPIEVISQETGAKILPLNTIGALTNEDIQKKADFISLMKENLDNLKKALE
ncbi:MAG: zinc ABC transporter substrate-binding protein [Thermoanaerobacteraceae bacterium]|nr:zinc ABC transporter substrate-binding protein [Thermoanaerobacteraceae bacterium]